MARNLHAELTALIRRYQRDTDEFDQAVSDRLGVNRTDLRCLDWLLEHTAAAERVTPKMLAEACGLSPSTVTSVLDRLEQAGHVRRRRDTENRRQVLLQPTATLAKQIREMFHPVAHDADDELCAFSRSELEVLIRFFSSANELHKDRLRRIREGAFAGRGRPRAQQADQEQGEAD